MSRPISVVVAADYLVVPTSAEYLPLEALAHFLRRYRDLHAWRQGLAALLGIVLTRVDHRAEATREVVDIGRSHKRKGVFPTEIPRDPRAAEAPSHALPLAVSPPWSPPAAAYASLTTEILRRLGHRGREQRLKRDRRLSYDLTRRSRSSHGFLRKE